jgi:hypothetical protein
MELPLPLQTLVTTNIPKNKFYAQMKMRVSAKREFIDAIEQIIWQHKLSPKTINIPATDTVAEIQVFRVVLKQPEIPKLATMIIDKTVQYPVLFQFVYQQSVCYGISLRFAGDDRWYFSTWNAPIDFRFSAQNLERVYQQIVAAFIPTEQKEATDFTTLITNDKEKKRLEREIAALKNKIHAERQFNNKVALNDILRSKQTELANLGL